MKMFKAVLLLTLLFAAFGIGVLAQDMDRDGIPDHLDRRPTVASYYDHSGATKINPADQAAGVDTDNDGIPDNLDQRPWVAGYYQHSGMAKVNPLSAGADTDMDGIPDNLDARPWVASYYQHSATPKFDAAMQTGDVDTDNDGLPDRIDSRPSVATYYQANMTAPAPKKMEGDADNDGVVNSKDKCPGTPVGARVDAVGCPMDSDGDGVYDGLDKCPNTPAGTKVNASGCPLDSDGDGVVDSEDKCPNTPAGVKVDATGCPLDSDNDGVPDHIDKCPNTPQGIPVDEFGCPKIMKKGEKITLQIEYATNSYEPDQKSKDILNGIAQTMKDFPEIKIAVNGFTDNVGGDSYNQKLSENRAKGVQDYLAAQGVDRGRMKAKGFGEDQKYFVGDNNTDEGRQKNRRVEVESVE
jgi:outer membrane protein OmpA-like peptidoglycan-associated protein